MEGVELYGYIVKTSARKLNLSTLFGGILYRREGVEMMENSSHSGGGCSWLSYKPATNTMTLAEAMTPIPSEVQRIDSSGKGFRIKESCKILTDKSNGIKEC